MTGNKQYSERTQYKIGNISEVPEPQRSNIRNLISLADDMFARNGLTGSHTHELLYNCVEGQIVLSLMPTKRKEGDYLSLSAFKIADNIDYDNEIYDIHNIILDLHLEFLKITKFKKMNHKVNDKVTVMKVIGSESMGYKLITRDAKVIGIGNMNIARPDYAVLDVLIGDDISPTRVTKADPHPIFWRLA